MKRIAAVVVPLVLACGSAPPSAERAQTLLEQGDFEGADRAADADLRQFPNHPTLWHVKIRASLGRGDNRAAVAHYERWLELRDGITDEAALRTMARGTLWQGLKVPSAEVRVAAIQAVERLELEALAPDVMELMASDDDMVAAAAAVAVLRSHVSAPKIAGDLLRSSDARARAIVIEGLGRKVKSLARDDITRALTDKDAAVRRAAVSALDRLTSDEDTDALVATVRADADGQVRARALRALARGKRRSQVELASHALDDDYVGVKLAAIEYLEEHGGDLGSGDLVKAAESDDLLVAIRASVALFKMGRGDGESVLRRALDAKPWPARASAVNALERAVPRPLALRLAGAALTDNRIEVRLAAARALLAMGSERLARQELTRALSNPSARARLDAAIDLVRLGDEPARTVLEALAESRDLDIRTAALPMQRFLPHPSRGLVRGLADDSAALRLSAAELILEMVH